ncbi:MAG: hypothetical protein BWY84_00799 [Candidatus Aerophobetes bacterium ADurb.Bin490]|nr:MAG: hypothetical protein BWY84_00799 [Candidatus Aerophobetes bacterium ADurb.Bin490]
MILGNGMLLYVSSRAGAIFFVTGPVITIPSACLGDATKSIPNLPMSKFTFEQAFNSISHPLQPPADTCLNFKERPKSLLISALAATAFSSKSAYLSPGFTINFSRESAAIWWDDEISISAFLHWRAHSPQNTHFPISIDTGPVLRAPVGHTLSPSKSSVLHFASITGNPRKAGFKTAFLTSGIA